MDRNPIVSLNDMVMRGLTLASVLCIFTACGGGKELSDAEKFRRENCPEVEAVAEFEETPFYGTDEEVMSFQNIRARVNTACASCHQVPAKTGGFTYTDKWQGGLETVNGETAYFQGFNEAADKMAEFILHPDEEKRMPPKDRRLKNPESFLQTGRMLQQWIAAGRPNGTFFVGKPADVPVGKPRPVKPKHSSELGECIPSAKVVGTDYKIDRVFETAKELPKNLSETDMFSLDPLELAQHGTFAYNVEYPLWADNANKGRWIHVPTKIEDGEIKKQSIEFDGVTGQFRIPPNTRFYKSFYRAVKLPNKKVRMRRMETRIIVARGQEDSLFGTYQWDETEQTATLVEAPRRDGTPWKDILQENIVVDMNTNKMRPYAIPGRDRCIDCHTGSPGRNFVLGFTPLQINKRPLGGGGRIDPARPHDLDQVQRFISYGLLSGIHNAEELPKLELQGDHRPSNEYELRASGYTVGNCYHCHNKDGVAFNKENGVKQGFAPGEIFGFNTLAKSVEQPDLKIVHQNGVLEASQIWRKIFDPPEAQGFFSQMPMHTPGSPNCKLLRIMGKWIKTFESTAAADLWEPECKKENPFQWIDTDLTQTSPENYTPRRADWANLRDGMPQRFRDLEFTPTLKAKIQTEYAADYYQVKPECQFPVVDLPPEKRRPWMMKDDKVTPKRPFGEVYYTKPGAYMFRNSCMKCHGIRADGVSSWAKGILNWSGGAIRVADFMKGGMFANHSDNLKTFQIDGKNYGGNYMIWMAMEGTRVKFPPEVSSIVGKHGGKMLNWVREKCLRQISIDKKSKASYQDHEIFRNVCFAENLEYGHPDLAFNKDTLLPVYPEKVEAWLDRAAFNGGWAVFDYLDSVARSDVWPAELNQCELVYPKK